MVVEHLDTTIRDIRGAIFELRTPAADALRSEIRALVDEARGPLGFRPQLTLDGPIDSVVPDSLRPAVIAVLREALSNVARHAAAATVTVEVRARDGLLIAVCHPGDRAVAAKAQHVVEVPVAAELLSPLVTVVPLQLLAYHVAVRRGCDVDQPRNLAKSVTVE